MGWQDLYNNNQSPNPLAVFQGGGTTATLKSDNQLYDPSGKSFGSFDPTTGMINANGMDSFNIKDFQGDWTPVAGQFTGSGQTSLMGTDYNLYDTSGSKFGNINPNSQMINANGMGQFGLNQLDATYQSFLPGQTTPTPQPQQQQLGGGGMDLSGLQNPYNYTGIKDPQMKEALSGLVSELMGLTPMWQQAQQRMMGLPEEIDQGTQDIIGNYRATTDDVLKLLSDVTNQGQRAGFRGGNDFNDFRSGVLSNYMQNIGQQRADAMTNGQNLRSAAIMSAPQTASMPYDALSNMLGLSRESMSEDTLGVPSLVAQILGFL